MLLGGAVCVPEMVAPDASEMTDEGVPPTPTTAEPSSRAWLDMVRRLLVVWLTAMIVLELSMFAPP